MLSRMAIQAAGTTSPRRLQSAQINPSMPTIPVTRLGQQDRRSLKPPGTGRGRDRIAKRRRASSRARM